MNYERDGATGRHPLQEPSSRDIHILEALRDGHSQAEVGRVYGLSRQFIFQIKQRWPHLAPRVRPQLKRKTGGKHNGTNTTLRSQGSRLPAAKRLHSYPPKPLVGE